jgi:glycosyltransferase involved in cell wall biosynthesis
MFEFTNSQPLVSVGIPTYNRPEGLRHTLECITGQTYRNLEIIVSNNCSPNPAVDEVVESFISDSRIKYFKQAENLGPGFNFRFVLEKSSGEYFMWLGDDDWIDSSYISECVRELIEHSDYSLVSGKPLFYVNRKFSHEDISLNLMSENGQERLLSYYEQVGENGVFYGLMKRNQISLIPMPNTMGGDWLMVASLAFLGKINTMPHVAVHRESNWSVDYHKKLARRIGLSEFQGTNPYLSIALAASKDVMSALQIYGSLSLLQRITLSQKVLILLLKQKHIPLYTFTLLSLVRSRIPEWAYPHLRKLYKQIVRKWIN